MSDGVTSAIEGLECPLASAIGDAVVATDLDGTIRFWNAAAERLYGWTAAEVIGRSGAEVTAPQLARYDRHEILRTITNGETWTGAFPVTRKDGTAFVAQVTDAPLRGPTGAVVGIVGVSREFTAAADHGGDIANLDDLIVVAIDGQGRITYVSPQVPELLGYAEAELLGSRIDGCTHPDDVDRVGRAVEAAMSGESVLSVVFRLVHRNGSVRWVESAGHAVGQDGVADGFIALGRDVTAERLPAFGDEARARRVRLAEYGSVAVIAFDAAGRCTLAGGSLVRGERWVGAMVGDAARRRGIAGLGRIVDRVIAGECVEADLAFGPGMLTLQGRPAYERGTIVGGLILVTPVPRPRIRRDARGPGDRSHFRSLVERGADIVLVVDEEMRITYVSPSVTARAGYRPEEMIGRLGSDFIHPDDLESAAAVWTAIMEQPGASGRFEVRARFADGRWVWIEEQVVNMLDDPMVRGIVSRLRDVSRERAIAMQLKRIEARFASIVETAAEGICLLDEAGVIELANPRLGELLGRAPEDLVARPAIDFVHASDVSRVREAFALPADALPVRLELKLVDADGLPVDVMVAATVFEGSLLVMLTDISERKRFEAELERRALTDTLTELPNRTLLLDRLELALARAQRQGHRVAVLAVGLDHFRLVNEAIGHAAGDEVLRSVGARLHLAVRSGYTTVARGGGDGFVVLCEELWRDSDALVVAQRLQDAFAAPFVAGGRPTYVTASIGIATGPWGEATRLLANAEAAMFRAKARGRARIEVYDDELRSDAADWLELATDLRDAIARGEMHVHYQPIVRIDGEGVVGAEALLRWHHAERGLVPAARTIAVAEGTGLISDIGRYVLQEAATQAAAWARDGLDLSVAVNLSARQLASPQILSDIESVLRTTGVDPGRIVLEITETAVEDGPGMAALMQQIRALGVRIAIDDFGTGYNSLARLRELPIDVLKIDRSFISPLPERGRALVEAVAGLARATEVDVVAEGVESEDHLRTLAELGCALGQGYLWSPAVPGESFGALVARLGGVAARPAGSRAG